MIRRETVRSELTQEEKRATFANDRRVHKNTYFSHAHPDEGDRFAVSDQPPRHSADGGALVQARRLPRGTKNTAAR